MRSFAIEEPGSPVPALYATLELDKLARFIISSTTRQEVSRCVGQEEKGNIGNTRHGEANRGGVVPGEEGAQEEGQDHAGLGH